ASAIGRLTTAVGVVTALDVVDSDHNRIIADLTCDTADSPTCRPGGGGAGGDGRRGGPKGLRPYLPAAPRRQDRGTSEGRPAYPGRAVAGVHARGGPGVPGHRREPRRRPPADDQAQHGRRGDRRLRRTRAGQPRTRGPWCSTPRTPTRSSTSC